MKRRALFISMIVACLAVFASPVWAQDLGPHFRKIKEGIYVQSAREVNSNCGIILTREGVVLIDSGHKSNHTATRREGRTDKRERDRTAASEIR